MPLIWCAISGHGFGHAAQVVPVLNALGTIVPGTTAILRTTVPASFFRNRLMIPWDLQAVQQDIGCVQDGPLTIDIRTTWAEHHRFHETWATRLSAEVDAIKAASPSIVIADTPYLAIEAGSHAQVPTVALASFTWDLILKELSPITDPRRQQLIQRIRESYANAHRAIRLNPAPKIDTFSNLTDIDPIASPAAPERDKLASALALTANETTVLVGFGGIPLTSLPFKQMERLGRYRFLIDGPVPPGYSRIHSSAAIPLSFKTLLASVDIIMTKPGYGTIVEAVALQQPVVYVRRYNFADESPLIDYLHRYGRGIELSMEDFLHGRWEATLKKLIDLPIPARHPPPNTGTVDAATILAKLL